MLGRIFGYRQHSINNNNEPMVDCFECRMVSGTGLTGLGGYIIYLAYKKRDAPIMGRLTMFGAGFVGSIIMTLGLLRLAGLDERTQAAKWAAVTNHPTSTTTSTRNNDGELLKD